MTRIPRSAILALAAALMALPVGAQTSISTGGAIESKSGGFKFPDGSVQQAAAVPLGDCPTMDPSDEMIWVGGVCIDKYEASIWDAPVGGDQITGATPCSPDGQDCDNIYARSVAGVEPVANITWFQAQAALANAGKRLPTNAEWQMAVRGTPDPGDIPGPEDCFTDGELSDGPDLTGGRENCVSVWGAFDMVGNLWEWVADWVPASTDCPGWGSFSDDFMCLSGASTTAVGALFRGGFFSDGTLAGPFAVRGHFQPSLGSVGVGFRGVR